MINQEGASEVQVCEQEEDDDADKTVPLPDDEEELLITKETMDNEDKPSWNEVEICSVSTVYPSQPNTLNHSMWSVNSSFNGETMDFLRLKFEKVAHFGPIEFTVRGRSIQALVTPHDIAYVPSSNTFLVTETFRDRVGVYDAPTFAFKSLLTTPEISQFYQTLQYFVPRKRICLYSRKGKTSNFYRSNGTFPVQIWLLLWTY